MSTDFPQRKTELQNLYKEVSMDTIEFIWKAYESLGQDPRKESSHRKAEKKKSLENIKEGDILSGVVRNVVAFGAFVDI